MAKLKEGKKYIDREGDILTIIKVKENDYDYNWSIWDKSIVQTTYHEMLDEILDLQPLTKLHKAMK